MRPKVFIKEKGKNLLFPLKRFTIGSWLGFSFTTENEADNKAFMKTTGVAMETIHTTIFNYLLYQNMTITVTVLWYGHLRSFFNCQAFFITNEICNRHIFCSLLIWTRNRLRLRCECTKMIIEQRLFKLDQFWLKSKKSCKWMCVGMLH